MLIDAFFYILVDVIGNEQTMQCDNSIRATYCLWQRQSNNGTFEDLRPNDAKYSKIHNCIMKIKNIDSRDSGVYRCRLFWSSGNNHYSSHIELSKYINFDKT